MRDAHELDRQKWTGKEKSPGKVKNRDEHYGGRKRKGWETVNISGASNS